MSQKVKHTLKDSTFRHIFKEAENFVQLFEVFTSRKLSTDEIEFKDTDSIILSKDLKNDISFITKDNRLIVMVEHQSTQCPNMALRMLIYYAELLKIHVKKYDLNIYGTAPIPYPKAEFYVAYNGKKPWEVEYLEISAGDVQVKAKLIDINYHRLPEDKKKASHPLAGYAYFMQQIEYYEKIEGSSLLEAVHQAAKDCKANGYLKGYIEREEFLTMVTKRWTVEQQLEDHKRWAQEAEERAQKAEEEAKKVEERAQEVEEEAKKERERAMRVMEAMEQAKVEKKLEKLEIARELLNSGVSIDLIMEKFGFSAEDLS